MATWKSDVVKALKNLGGIAHRSKILEEIKKIRPNNLNNTWEQTVQRELESHSSDSDAFLKKQDLFYMAEGKGKGFWGLREKVEKFKFGHIEDISVGQIFESRKELSDAGVHGPPMGGIWGREKEGACSIVLSGGYEDDIDELDYIYYTGAGGQDKPGGKQVANQKFTNENKALVVSHDFNLPVRVTRGHQVNFGPPPKGYRYDGLYYVKDYELVKGKNGFDICRFHLVSENKYEFLEKKIQNTLKPNFEPPERKQFTVNRLSRNPKLSVEIKEMYDFSCQVCGVKLLGHKFPIAVGAHIKDLGKPHNGPDLKENILCLCPNHHSLFDNFGFYIDPETLEINGLANEKVNAKLTLNSKHKINKDFLQYKFEQFKKREK